MLPIKLSLLITLILLTFNLFAQTETPPVYSTDGYIDAMETYGDTLIVGGRFSHVGKYTGSGAYFSTTSDEPILTFPKLNGNVTASCSDGNGGFYIIGNYYRESEDRLQNRLRVEHILSDFTFEAGFSLTVNATRVNKLLFQNGLLYVGGWNLTQIASQTATNLSVINVATQQVQSWVPTITLGTSGVPEITNLMIARGTLYFIGNFTEVAGQPRKNAAAIAIGTGTLRAWNPAPNLNNGGYSDLLSYDNSIVIGGAFGTPGLPTDHAAALVDTASGSLIKYLFKSGGLFGNNATYLYQAANVTALAIKGSTLFAYSTGTLDTRVTAINLTQNAPYNVLWMKYFNRIAGARNMAVVGNSLYLAGGNFENVYKTDSTNAKDSNIERKVRNIVRLNTTTGDLENWFPDPVAQGSSDVLTILVSGNNLFFGGAFSHMKGQDRSGLFMLQNSTQTVLPFQIDAANSGIFALKRVRDTLYVGGSYLYIAGKLVPLAVYHLGTGTRINSTTISLGATVNAIEVSNRHIFIGGTLNEPAGGANRTNLFAIDRQTGNLNSWAPNPNLPVYSLHIRNNRLYVGGQFLTISSQSQRGLAAYDLNTLNLTNWNPSVNGTINEITSVYGTIWIGGGYGTVGGVSHSLAASINEQTGAANSFPNFQFPTNGTVGSFIPAGRYMLAGGGLQYPNNSDCYGLFIYDMYSKAPVSSSTFCQNLDGQSRVVNATAKVGNNWYFGGGFTKVNGKIAAPYIGRIQFPAGYFDNPGEYVTARDGSWYDPTTWQVQLVPPQPANVTINHKVSLPANTTSKRVKYGTGGSVNFTNGTSLKVSN